MVLNKLFERDRRASQQTGNGIGDSRCRAAGKIAEQFAHRPNVPFGHSRFAHSVGRCGEWHIHVLNFSAKNCRQSFSGLLKCQSFRPGDDISISFMARSDKNFRGNGVDVPDIHRALRCILKRPIKSAMRLDSIGGGKNVLMKGIRPQDRERHA